jgi:hypothetical protein
VTMQSLVFSCHSVAWKTGLASMGEIEIFHQSWSFLFPLPQNS